VPLCPLPQGSAGRSGIVKVLNSLPVPRLAPLCTPAPPDKTAGEIPSRALQRSASDVEASCAALLAVSESTGSLWEAALTAETTDDTTVTGDLTGDRFLDFDTAEPSETSCTTSSLRVDASATSLSSTDSHATAGNDFFGGAEAAGPGGADLAASPSLDSGPGCKAESFNPAPPPGPAPVRPAPRLAKKVCPEPIEPGQKLAALQSLYGARIGGFSRQKAPVADRRASCSQIGRLRSMAQVS
jgi:hypothetical protein